MAKVDNITRGPIYPTIIRLAWPVVAGMFLEFALSITDYFWVGYLGTPEQDAITTSTIVTWTLFAFSSIIVAGLTAMVSRSIGGNKPARASFVSRQGLQMAVGIGLFLAVCGIWLTPTILTFMKASSAVVALGIPYLRIFFAGMIVMLVNEALAAIFRASGDTRSPTIAFAAATCLNIVLDPVLIFGWGPFPEMGVAGAATATVVSMVLCLLLLIFLLWRVKLEFSLRNWYRTLPDLKTMGRIVRIGMPISMQNVVFIIVYWFIIQIVHHYGNEAGAGMGIGNRMEALSYLIAFGFSMATATLVGQNLGAGKAERAAQCVRGSIKIIVIETFIVSVLFLVFPRFIAGLFSSDPAAIAIARDYLIILGLSQVFMGIEIVLEGAFTGAGNTIPPMAVAIPGSLLRLPLAYYLCFSLDIGINGVWWSLTITSFLKAMVLLFWFSRGRWKKKKV